MYFLEYLWPKLLPINSEFGVGCGPSLPSITLAALMVTRNNRRKLSGKGQGSECLDKAMGEGGGNLSFLSQQFNDKNCY